MYGHRGAARSAGDGLPSIDNSWGAYGAQEGADAVGALGAAAVRDAYSRWHGLGADERSPLGQAAVLSERPGRSTDQPVQFVHVAVPHRPWVLSPQRVRRASFAAELISDPDDPAVRVRGAGRVPAAQPAGRRRRHSSPSCSTTSGACRRGGDAARGDVWITAPT